MNSRIISIIAMIFMAIPSWAYPFPVQNDTHNYLWSDAYGQTAKEAKYNAMLELTERLGILVESEITTENHNGQVNISKRVTSTTYNAFFDMNTHVIYNDNLKCYQGYAYIDVDEHISMVRKRYEEYMSVSGEIYTVLLGHYFLAFCIIERDVIFKMLCPEADALMKHSFDNINAVRELHDKQKIWFADRLENGDIIMFDDVPKPFFAGSYEDIRNYFKNHKHDVATIRYTDGSYHTK